MSSRGVVGKRRLEQLAKIETERFLNKRIRRKKQIPPTKKDELESPKSQW